MDHIPVIVLGVIAIAVLLWMMKGTSSSKTAATNTPEDQIIDPSDSRQIGLLIGMFGGDVADAAVARYALQQFEEIHGRKATSRDVGTVVGLMSTMSSL